MEAVTVGLRSEAAFAQLCGAAPVPASSGTASTRAATAMPTGRCTWWRSTALGATHAPKSTWQGAPLRVKPRGRRCGASSGTSPARSTGPSRLPRFALPRGILLTQKLEQYDARGDAEVQALRHSPLRDRHALPAQRQ